MPVKGKIPIVDTDGKHAMDLQWTGTNKKGLAEWVNIRDDDVEQKLSNALAFGADLGEDKFFDLSVTNARYTKGWQGFTGYHEALRLCLPVYGLDIDSENVIWPTDG